MRAFRTPGIYARMFAQNKLHRCMSLSLGRVCSNARVSGRVLRLTSGVLALLLATVPSLSSDQESQAISIQVHFNEPDGPMIPVWNYFGYDEPNYTYAPNGKKLLSELAALSPTPVYVRVHNLLTTGDGAASLQWASPNGYTEAPAGNPI